MKLKSLKKLCSEVRYHITVFENNTFLEDFKIDYIDMTHEEIDLCLNKYFKYENSKVRNIDTSVKYDGTSWLEISVNL